MLRREKTIFEHGFTLVELLVVISIISLLSSVSLAAFNTARERARVTAALQFATSVDHFLGADRVGVWEIEEGSGTTLTDLSGYGNSGSFSGLSWEIDRPKGNWALSSFSSSNFVTVPSSAKYNFGTGDFTISLWYKTLAPANAYAFLSRRTDWVLGIYNNKITFSCVCIGSGSFTAIAPQDGRWHHVAVSTNATGITYYFDGRNVGSYARTDTLTNLNAPLLFGYDPGAGTEFSALNGLMDDVRIYAAAIP